MKVDFELCFQSDMHHLVRINLVIIQHMDFINRIQDFISSGARLIVRANRLFESCGESPDSEQIIRARGNIHANRIHLYIWNFFHLTA